MINNKIKQTLMIGLSLSTALTMMPMNASAASEKYDISKYCTLGASATTNCTYALYEAVMDIIDEIGFDSVTTIDGEVKVATSTPDSPKTLTLFQAIKEYEAELRLHVKLYEDDETAEEQFDELLDIIKMINDLFGSDAIDKPSDAYSEAGLIKTINESNFYENKKPTNANIRIAKQHYSKLNAFYDLTDHLTEDLATAFDTAYEKVDSFIYDFVDEDEMYADFVEMLEKVLEADLDGDDIRLNENEKSILGLQTDTLRAVDTSNKSAIKSRIKLIKAMPDYKSFENEKEVEDIIAEYESMLENVEDLKDLTKEKAYKTYIKDKTSDEKTTVINFINSSLKKELKRGFTKVSDEPSKTTLLDETETIISVLDMEQYEVLKDLMKDVVNKAWDFETKEYKNRYTDKSDWVKGLSSSLKTTLNKNIPAFLLMMVDSDTGESGWDMISKHMDEVEKAYKAVTTDLEGINQFMLKASDGKLIDAANEAIYDLTDGGDFVDNLTSKQNKELRHKETEIRSLHTAYLLQGLNPNTQTGWVDKGNGDWAYYENGNTVTKWVASGSNWYYVKNGIMLRNTWVWKDSNSAYYVGDNGAMVTGPTSVNGYQLDAYGLWHRK